MASSESYNEVLGRMSGLTDLANHIETITQGKDKQSQEMMQVIGEMSKIITDVRENVDKIKTGSVAIGERMKEVIKNSEDTQKTNLAKIKASITTLGNINPLNESLKRLDEQVNLLAQKALPVGSSGSASSSNDAAGSGSSAKSSDNDDDENNDEEGSMFKDSNKKGGYTYGKSRKRGKGRRRRTKKSRRKGKGSKKR